MIRIPLAIFVLVANSGLAVADQSQSKRRSDESVSIKLYLVELNSIDGVTNPKGFEYTENGRLAYYHQEPSLVVRPSDVQRIVVRRQPASDIRTKPGFSIEIHLTESARKRISAKAIHGEETRFMSAFFGDKKSRGLKRYEISKTYGVPEDCQAKMFVPTLDFSHSDVRIQDVVAALIGDQ